MSTSSIAPNNNGKEDARPLLKACVIGAGPSGLVAAKYLLHNTSSSSSSSDAPRFDVTIMEASHQIGGTFCHKVYDQARLVSSKFLTAFSDFRFSASMPNHPTTVQYVQYLEDYAEHFDLKSRIQFQCEIVTIQDYDDSKKKEEDDDSQGYWVEYRDLKQPQPIVNKMEHFDVVLVCSGLHNTPHVPLDAISNHDKFQGQMLHSSQYKHASLFDHQRVLILGAGETAMDVALRAVQNPTCRDVALCVRTGFLSVPHNLAEDRPLDVFITNLFEHAYEHPWIFKWKLRWHLSTVVIRAFLLLTGSSVGFNQWACPISPVQRGYHIINKSHQAMAHLNVPIKQQYGLWGKFWMWVYGETNLRPIHSFYKTQVERINDNGTTVHFTNGQRYDADVIVLATGYQQQFPFLSDQIKQDHQHPCRHLQQQPTKKDSARNNGVGVDNIHNKQELSFRHAQQEDLLPSEHFIVSPKRPRLGFIGFVRPNVGAIPPMSEMQVMWWLQNLQGKVQRMDNNHDNPRRIPSYMVLGRKYQYGVDYGNYMHRLAEDMGAAPTLGCLLKSPKPLVALYTYCQGQAHIPLFRLVGPYASDECMATTTGELWDVCCRRGGLENFGLASVTWVSLWMNMGACVLEAMWGLVTLRRPQFFVRYG